MISLFIILTDRPIAGKTKTKFKNAALASWIIRGLKKWKRIQELEFNKSDFFHITAIGITARVIHASCLPVPGG